MGMKEGEKGAQKGGENGGENGEARGEGNTYEHRLGIDLVGIILTESC